jgi:nucleotide-binding universal stress UspA family protein
MGLAPASPFLWNSIMIKDVLVPITHTVGDADALAAAIALAIHENAHLNVLEFVNLPLPPFGPWGNGELELGEIYKKCRIAAETDAVALRQRLAKEIAASEVRIVESIFTESADLAAKHAHCSDLIVMPMASSVAGDTAIVRGFFTAMLLGSGRPVLLVPPGYTWKMAKHAVLAWRPTCEAARSLHDALPLLRDVESIDVLQVDVGSDKGGESPLPGGDPVVHLCRHGLKATVVAAQSGEDSIASVLIKHAQNSGADLLVAGGYGHSRFREWALGGATRDLLSSTCSVPILLSH